MLICPLYIDLLALDSGEYAERVRLFIGYFWCFVCCVGYCCVECASFDVFHTLPGVCLRSVLILRDEFVPRGMAVFGWAFTA